MQLNTQWQKTGQGGGEMGGRQEKAAQAEALGACVSSPRTVRAARLRRVGAYFPDGPRTVPGGLLRKFTRHCEGRPGSSAHLLPRSSSGALPGAGARPEVSLESRVLFSAPVRPLRPRDVATTPDCCGRWGLPVLSEMSVWSKRKVVPTEIAFGFTKYLRSTSSYLKTSKTPVKDVIGLRSDKWQLHLWWAQHRVELSEPYAVHLKLR